MSGWVCLTRAYLPPCRPFLCAVAVEEEAQEEMQE